MDLCTGKLHKKASCDCIKISGAEISTMQVDEGALLDMPYPLPETMVEHMVGFFFFLPFPEVLRKQNVVFYSVLTALAGWGLYLVRPEGKQH